MIKVMIDGKQLFTDLGSVKSMGDLIELIKASIDPDTIITTLAIAGRQLADSDWRAPISVQGNSVLEVTTGTKESYVKDRFSQSPEIVNHILNEFLYAREFFQKGVAQEANNALVRAVEDLNAFINWYNTLLATATTVPEIQKQTFVDQITLISKTCESLVQQQLYQSWWALGQTIESQLEPQLGKLREECARFAA